MAIALTKVADSEVVSGNRRSVNFTFAGDASYPAGGYAITPANIGLSKITDVQVVGVGAVGARFLVQWDRVNGKLMFLYPTGGATVAPGAIADPISTTGGASATAVDAVTPNITPGRGKELLATTNATTITGELQFSGY